MAIAVSRIKKAYISAGRCPAESGRVSLGSAHRGESNGIGLEASTCLYHSVVNNLKILTRGTQVQMGGYLFNQRSDSIGTGCVGIHRSRGIEWCRFRSVHMAIAVRRMKKADISAGRCPAESGRVQWGSARRGESNSIGFEASAWLERSAGCKRQVSQGADVRQSRERSHWSPLAEGN